MISDNLIQGNFYRLLEVEGNIANIERYAINDGNGVRTTVFTKGCFLRCKWCSNPETQQFYSEMTFFPDKCIACKNCLRLCPYNAMGEDLIADRKICAECHLKEQAFACTTKCYPGCRKITGEKKTVKEVYDTVKRDVPFYESSGGGVTISGGEPMAQPEFTYALLRVLTERWIDTAIETCGFAQKDDYEKCVPYLNTIFMDIKHMDSMKHKEWTGHGNEQILENVKLVDKLAGEYGNRLFIRVPVIPAFNERAEEIEDIAKFVAGELSHVTGMELLPYHKLGRGKYYSLGRPYPMEDTEPPKDEYMSMLNGILAKYNIPVYQF